MTDISMSLDLNTVTEDNGSSHDLLSESKVTELVISSEKSELLPSKVLIPKSTTDLVTSNVLSVGVTLPNVDASNINGHPNKLDILIPKRENSNDKIIKMDSMKNSLFAEKSDVGLAFPDLSQCTSKNSINANKFNKMDQNSNTSPLKRDEVYYRHGPSRSLTLNMNNHVNAKRSSIYESKSTVKAIPIRNPNTANYIENITNEDSTSTESRSSSMNTSLSKSFLFGFYNTYKKNPKNSQKYILSKEYWMKDESAKECFICMRSFNTFRRKHHCRMCGQIFCSNCVAPIPGDKFGHNGLMKICKNCLRHLETYEDSSDEESATINESCADDTHYNHESTPDDLNDLKGNKQEIFLLNSDGDDIQSIITTGDDSKLFLTTPPPLPKMTIPATRQGESLEIFYDSNKSHGNNKLKKSFHENGSIYGGSNQRDRYTIRDVDEIPNQYEIKLSPFHNKIKPRPSVSSLKRSIFNYVGGSKSPQDKYLKGDLDGLDAVSGHLGKRNFKFEFNYGKDNASSLKSRAPKSKFLEKDINELGNSPPFSNFTGLEKLTDELSSEDEGSMSIYSSLTGNKHKNNPMRSMRSSTKSSQRAEASLQRIRFRRKSKSRTYNAGNTNSLYRGVNLLAHSTPNLISVIDNQGIEDDEIIFRDRGIASASVSNICNIPIKPKSSGSSSIPYRRSVSISAAKTYRENRTELSDVSILHMEYLLKQVMDDQELLDESEWMDLMNHFLRKIQNIAISAKDSTTLDFRQNYVKIKRIAGGFIEDSEYIDGIVFSKGLPSKIMPRYIENPRILLIMFPLEYKKNENQFLSIKTVMAQEAEYLNKLISRVTSLNPDIIFVGANVSGYALDLLNKSGVIVQYNIKPQVIERISKLSEADIAISVDKLAANVKMGECNSFEVKTFIYGNISKSYTFLRGCNPSLGGTILLRGLSEIILQKLKQAAEFMVYVTFSLKLENAFFKDNFIQPSLEYYVERKNRKENNPESGYFSEFMKKFNSRILTVSPTVEFPVPYLLRCARELEYQLQQKKEQNMKLIKNVDELDFKGFLPSDIEAKLTKQDLKYLAKFVHDKEIEYLELQFQKRSRQWELSYSQSHNLLGTGSHQSITVLYSMVSTKTATPCIGPQIVNIDYFWESDISIGQFIENIVATAMYPCHQGCNGLLLDHYRSYVNGSGKVDVLIERFQTRLPKLTDIILTWNYCKKCGTSTPILQLGQNTWNYSFGKFLEVMYWSNKNSVTQVSTCGHDFTKDHVKYFGYNDLAVRIEYSELEVYELVTPPRKIVWKSHKDIKLKIELYYNILDKINSFYSSVTDRIKRIKLDSIYGEKFLLGQKQLSESFLKVEEEKRTLLDQLEMLYRDSQGDEHLKLNAIINGLVENVSTWHSEFNSFAEEYMPSEKEISLITSNQLKKLFDFDEKNSDSNESIQNQTIETKNNSTLEHIVGNNSVEFDCENNKELIQGEHEGRVLTGNNSEVSTKSESLDLNSQADIKIPKIETSPVKRVFDEMTTPDIRRLSLASNDSFSSYLGKEYKTDTKVGKLASFFDQMHLDALSKEFEIQRELERLHLNKTKYVTHRLQPTTPIVDIYKNVKDAVDEPLHDKNTSALQSENYGKDSQTGGIINSTEQRLNQNLEHELETSIYKWGEKMFNIEKDNKDESNDHTPGNLSDKKDEDTKTTLPTITTATNVSKDETNTQPEKSLLMKTLSNFWADRSASLWKPLEEPTLPAEHIFPDSDVMIREDEPSSLIAFCLSIPDYTEKMISLKKTKNAENDNSTNTLTDNVPESNIDDEVTIRKDNDTLTSDREPNSPSTKTSQYDLQSNKEESSEEIFTQDQILETIMMKKTAVHLRYQFQDQDTVMSCKIFYAEHFEAFRSICGCHKKYIQSLSRCIKWDSSGGKSGSGFLKTLDDRFILKELSHAELDAFIKFAPSYFEYMSQAMFHDLPTSLAKVFGFYQIQVKSTSGSKGYKMDLIIMENLFYEKKTTRIFDLKGSMRNRHVEQTGKENEVLLDENMVEYIYESPIHVREYDKKLLRASLWNDTLFLAKMNVMDYSLVIGIDNEGHTLTVGIIDFIRTFTWDKKLESWVKEKGLVGGNSTKKPTVVTPRQYKNRFREAMERYILMVPDPWYQEAN